MSNCNTFPLLAGQLCQLPDTALHILRVAVRVELHYLFGNAEEHHLRLYVE